MTKPMSEEQLWKAHGIPDPVKYIERYWGETIVTGGDADIALHYAREIRRLRAEREKDREAMREALDRLGLMSDSRSHELCDQLRGRLEAE